MKDNTDLMTAPNAKWEEFLVRAEAHASTPIEKWRTPEMIGYFMLRFKEAFGKDYALKFNTPTPSKSYEVFRLNTCGTRLSNDPAILKGYIDWIFDQRVAKDKKSFRSIAFLVAEDNVQWYRTNILFAGQTTNIDRSTKLPDNIQAIVETLGCSTYGDLAFMLQSNTQSDALTVVKNALKNACFDLTILGKIV